MCVSLKDAHTVSDFNISDVLSTCALCPDYIYKYIYNILYIDGSVNIIK